MNPFYKFLFLTFLLPSFALAQESKPTILFQNISFKQALDQSEKTGKLIFVDCYTSWCAPCKWMEQNVFVNDSVYKYFNAHFVNFKIDMEKGEGPQLREKYKVASYPTYLFLNENGDIIHRTGSKMEVSEFLKQGETANNPALSYSALKKKYESGDRSNLLLFRYTLALQKINRQQADSVKQELVSKITDKELSTPLGWQIVDQLSINEKDRLGTFFTAHKALYEGIAGKQAVQSLTNRLGMNTMYQIIREKDSTRFFTRLDEMRLDPDKKVQRNVAMLEMEYYLTVNNADSFVLVSDRAMNGILEFDDFDLSFIARRADYMGKNNPVILHQALVLARKAVQLNPEEYSNQGTLASICLDLKLKDEGIVAAKKAREISNQFTSKIQKLAQELLDKLEAL